MNIDQVNEQRRSSLSHCASIDYTLDSPVCCARQLLMRKHVRVREAKSHLSLADLQIVYWIVYNLHLQLIFANRHLVQLRLCFLVVRVVASRAILSTRTHVRMHRQTTHTCKPLPMGTFMLIGLSK
jgi:hypothetical protein